MSSSGKYYDYVGAGGSNTITFTSTYTQSPNPPDTWAWDFGDSSTSSLQNPPAHTYAAGGAYNCSISLGKSGNWSATVYFTVLVPVPSIDNNVHINAPPLTIAPLAIPSSYTNAVYPTQTFVGSGGVPPYVWTDIGSSLPTGITFNPTTQELAGTPTVNGNYNLDLLLTDSIFETDNVNYPFSIYDPILNDTPLSITVIADSLIITTNSLPGSCRGGAYSQTLAATDTNPPHTWSIYSGSLPPSLSLNSSTGEISGTVDAGATPQVYNFTVRAINSDPLTTDKPLSIEVYPEPPWVTNTLPFGAITRAYSTQLNATGAVTYTLQAGSLPTGLTLHSNGLIDGTPTILGASSFTVRATDAHGCEKDKVLSITIYLGPSIGKVKGPTGLTDNFPNICKGATYNTQLIVDTTAPPVTFAITSGSLPDGITLDPAAGTVAGASAQPGTFNFSITVTDIHLLTDTKSFFFSVFNTPTIITTSIPSGLYGKPYSFKFDYVDGAPPLTWILSGALPQGMLFNSLYGALSGTPFESGDSPLSLTLLDTNGCSFTKSVTLQILGPPIISTPTLPPACQNSDYGQHIVVTGGQAPYYYFISSVDFPPQDISLDPYTGMLSGIPLIAGTFNFTIKVVDQNNLFSEKSYKLLVRTEQECGQLDEGPSVTVTVPRLASLETDAVVVQDPFHQKHLMEYNPVPFEGE